MNIARNFAALTLSVTALLPLGHTAWAGEGHDHGDAAPAAQGAASPRFTAVSDDFELVGVLDGKQITLYLDRAADNSPVREATIELDMGGVKLVATKQADDTYAVALADAPKPGVYPIAATITAGKDSDLLAGELDLHDSAQHKDAAHVHGWHEWAVWGVGAVLALAALGFVGRRLLSPRAARAGSAA
jgi:hypothetical protein